MRAKTGWNQVNWKPQSSIARSRISAPDRDWLFASGSLTRHLVRASGGDFRVQILRQEWSRACRHEARVLGISPDQACLVREVLLICRGRPWVYARSLLPERSLRGRLRFLRKLDTRPLGALLFRDQTMRRGTQEIAHLALSALPVAGARNVRVWGRRSVYFLHDCPLLVTEVFLPEIAEATPPSG